MKEVLVAMLSMLGVMSLFTGISFPIFYFLPVWIALLIFWLCIIPIYFVALFKLWSSPIFEKLYKLLEA